MVTYFTRTGAKCRRRNYSRYIFTAFRTTFPACMKTAKYYLAAVIAYAIWGFFSFVLKPLKDYPSLDILFYRVFSCAALMLFISFLLRPKTLKENKAIYDAMPARKKKKTILNILFGGIFLTGNWFFFIFVLNHISIKASSLAYMVCPILTTVLAYFFLKEKLGKWQWIAIAISTVSCLLLSFDDPMDLVYSMLIALSYALYLIIQPKNNQLDKFLLLTLQIAFSALLLLPFFPVYHGAYPTAVNFYVLIGVISVFFTIIPLLLNLYSLQGLKSSTVGILLYINPLISFAIALIHFHEGITATQLIAYSAILLSVIIFNLRPVVK